MDTIAPASAAAVPTGRPADAQAVVNTAVPPQRQAYYERIARQRLTPLWESLHALVPPQPRPKAVAAGPHNHHVRPTEARRDR